MNDTSQHYHSCHCSLLSRHNGAARLIFWQRKLSKAAPGTRAQKPDVVGDLHDAAGKHVAGARHLDHRIMGSQGLELVGGSDKWKTSEVSHLGGNFLSKANPSVQTCAYSSATSRQHVEPWQGCLNPVDSKLKLLDIA